MGNCYIIGAGKIEKININIKQNDLVITADGGYMYAINNGITPDVVLGDFDSLGFIPECENVICLPTKKDDTDTLAAVKFALSKGYKTFYIYGGTGGRTDHTIANIQTLSFIADNGGRGYLVSENEVISVVKNGEINFNDSADGTVSVFAFGGKAQGVTIKNLLYCLDNATLDTSFPIGVSNLFVGKRATIKVSDGKLLIVFKNLLYVL